MRLISNETYSIVHGQREASNNSFGDLMRRNIQIFERLTWVEIEIGNEIF